VEKFLTVTPGKFVVIKQETILYTEKQLLEMGLVMDKPLLSPSPSKVRAPETKVESAANLVEVPKPVESHIKKVQASSDVKTSEKE
jgi:hypothetical protein